MVETVRIDGLKELSKKLKRLPEKVRNKHLRATVREGAKVVLYGAIHNAPKDTGQLAGSLGIAVSKGRKGVHGYDYLARIGVRYAEKDKQFSLTGGYIAGKGSSYYWRFVEFGTEKMEERPFLAPAFEDNKRQILNIMIRRIRKGLAQEARKNA